MDRCFHCRNSLEASMKVPMSKPIQQFCSWDVIGPEPTTAFSIDSTFTFSDYVTQMYEGQGRRTSYRFRRQYTNLCWQCAATSARSCLYIHLFMSRARESKPRHGGSTNLLIPFTSESRWNVAGTGDGIDDVVTRFRSLSCGTLLSSIHSDSGSGGDVSVGSNYGRRRRNTNMKKHVVLTDLEGGVTSETTSKESGNEETEESSSEAETIYQDPHENENEDTNSSNQSQNGNEIPSQSDQDHQQSAETSKLENASARPSSHSSPPETRRGRRPFRVPSMSRTTAKSGLLCPLCGDHKHFESAEMLKQHLANHNAQRPYKCEKCTFTFSSGFLLKIHMKTHAT